MTTEYREDKDNGVPQGTVYGVPQGTVYGVPQGNSLRSTARKQSTEYRKETINGVTEYRKELSTE